MPIPRRRIGAALLGGLAVPALIPPVQAQGQPWPSRPIRLVSPFAPGGPQDVPARHFVDWLTPRLGQPVVFDSRAGAGGAVGMQYVAQAGDGHTFLITSNAVATLPAIRRNLGFDPFADLLPVTLVMQSPYTLVVRANGPASLAEFIAAARATPNRLTYGSSGVGASTHLTGAMLFQKAGVQVTHVPYRGAQLVMNALLAGDIDCYIGDVGIPLEHIRSGTVRCIGVTTTERAPLLPDVPSASDVVPGFASTLWYGLFAGRSTPPEAIERVLAELAPLRAPESELRMRVAERGSDLLLTGPQPLAERLRAEVPQWQAVIAAAGIEPE
ncbi:tripartite tricarboxylate transporter substrate binding protein [Siccirubricoccus sp. KC 17139]|uniref:Tripartite tricarboxylate transporter substrate binding protein n=1 Tax=Siccirubricoccus soli TaxID=2899147 RepID=A0ABT1DAM6_9PROT|nr:tripartite tricarboxylate transporter substrate-binding protein [Siccirubricoccus soli]MCO6418981.1 tripartite tricarboxylate transporter substrate binding protein [Siccirubricoccus soli]MCP2685116.1 tripartite tricarboxylate transporter substrate-binding protein [Siccirubricoccus soli]